LSRARRVEAASCLSLFLYVRCYDFFFRTSRLGMTRSSGPLLVVLVSARCTLSRLCDFLVELEALRQSLKPTIVPRVDQASLKAPLIDDPTAVGLCRR